jgi:hypothetical protein
MGAGRWCDAYDLRSEGSGRQIDQIGLLGKAGGPAGSPMDRDDTIWASAADRLCRLLGVEMTRTERGMFALRTDP